MICPCCAAQECECPDPCSYQLATSGEALTVSVEAAAVPDECEGCETASEEDRKPNPLNEDDQAGSQDVVAYAQVPGFGVSFGDGRFEFAENYAVTEPGGYLYTRSIVLAISFLCRKTSDVAQWFFGATYSYNESRSQYDDTADPLVVTKTQFSSASFAIIEEPIKTECPADPVSWTAEMDFEGVTINEVFYPWEVLSALDQQCFDVENNVACNDYLGSYDQSVTVVLSKREECEFP
jgi:hypothetical protein